MDKNVFIAMPFDPSFNEVYENAILPAILESNLNPYRVDELKVNSDIVQDIEEGIRNSFMVFADLTNKNPNVFYEVGFARAIGKNVIASTQKREDVTFDLRQRRYIHYTNTERGLKKFKNEIKQWLHEIIKNPSTHNLYPRVFIHGTKFDVPKKNEFWNELFQKADTKFYLLGGSNKSWVNKGEHQSEELAMAIVRIISNGGNIKIISDDLPATIANHKQFYKEYIKPKIIDKALSTKFKKAFIYGVVSSSNYQAVISDNRIVLLPKMNSTQFKDESLVMELEGSHLPHFKNYLADIERLLKEGNCKIIDITKDEKRTKNTVFPTKSA